MTRCCRKQKPLLDITSLSNQFGGSGGFGQFYDMTAHNFEDNDLARYIGFVNDNILIPYDENKSLVKEKLEEIYDYKSVYDKQEYKIIKTFTFHMINIIKCSFVQYEEFKTLQELIAELNNEIKNEYTEQTAKTNIQIKQSIDVELDMAYILYHKIYGIPENCVYDTYKLECIMEAILEEEEEEENN